MNEITELQELDLPAEIYFMRGFALGSGYNELYRSISCALIEHRKQARNGGQPYATHPIRCAHMLVTHGVRDERILSTVVLHDVPEDCGASKEDLIHMYGISEDVAYLATVLDKRRYKSTEDYYLSLRQYIETILTKIVDRCHNLATMVNVFSEKRMKKYIEETEEYVIPLCQYAVLHHPEYSNVVFALKRHIVDMLTILKALLPKDHLDEEMIGATCSL